MKRVINYIKNPIKTEPHLVGGKDCSQDTVFNEFVMTKQNLKKETGRQFIHFVKSFSPHDRANPEVINEIGKKAIRA